MPTRKGALAGVRVLDLTRNTAGLFCTMILADLGAEVIMIEPRQITPRTIGRFLVSRRNVDGLDMRTLHTHRSKKSLTLEIKSPQGQEVFRDLVRISDVVVNNYRPGVMEALELDHPRLVDINPRIISCSITGFGPSGPYRNRPGFDFIAQGMSGLMMRTGEAGSPPLFPGVPVADLGTAMFAAHGILAALYARERTGRGQEVSACLLNTSLALLYADGTYFLNTGIEPARSGTKHWALPLAGVYATRDGHIVICPISEQQVRGLLRAVGKEAVLQEPRFSSPGLRAEHKQELDSLAEEAFLSNTTAYWLERLEKEDVPAGPVNTVAQAFADPHILQGKMVASVPYKNRKYRLLGNPIQMSDGAADHSPPPTWGEHTEEILAGLLNYSPERIAALRQEKLV